MCFCLSPHIAFLVACHYVIVQEKEAAKKNKALAKAVAKAKGKGRGRGRGRGKGRGKGKGRSRNAQVPELPQVQDSEVEDELGDEEMLLPDESMATFRANVLAPVVPEDPQPAEPAHVLAPVVPEDPQPAEPAHVLAPVVPEDPQPAEPAHVLAPVVPEDPQPAEPAHVLAPVVPEDPQPAEPASALVSVPEDPQPAEPASASVSVPEEPAEPVLPPAVAPASLAPSEAAPSEAAGPSGVPRYVSPKEFSTPAEVQNLAPPHCTFVLDKKAHRFSFGFKKAPNPNVWKDVHRYPLTMSRAFKQDTWRNALLEIHTGAWERWGLAKEQKEWKISDEAHVQVPGCIPNNILESIQKSWPTVSNCLTECWPHVSKCLSFAMSCLSLGKSDTCCSARFQMSSKKQSELHMSWVESFVLHIYDLLFCTSMISVWYLFVVL